MYILSSLSLPKHITPYFNFEDLYQAYSLENYFIALNYINQSINSYNPHSLKPASMIYGVKTEKLFIDR